jgi:hypothetical protein
MSRYTRFLPVLLAIGLGLSLALAPDVGAEDKEKEIELDEAAVFIEWNSTDTDFGIQFFWDGEPWESMAVRDEDGRKVLEVVIAGNVKAQGLTEGFFESAEPPASELSMSEFLARFPEGEYEFRGKAQEGGWLEGDAELTHTLPSPPTGITPNENSPAPDPDGFTVEFNEVTTDTNGDPLDIELYEVVVEKEDDDPILQVFSVILSPDSAVGGKLSVFVPGEFLEPETEYKIEVIAQEESGNRTITETDTFETDS